MIPYTVCLERYRFYRISIGFYLVPLTEFSIYAGLFANIMVVGVWVYESFKNYFEDKDELRICFRV